ncbi:MAG: flagellar biosynthesis protein FlhB [Thermoleophilia bacterium]|nr:flagellar biosynthesis protein FlhB [Thermoleophilia bacterium]
MAEDRTEKATPKRRDDARQRGQVARSMEVNTALGVLALFMLLAAFGGSVLSGLTATMIHYLGSAGQTGDISPARAIYELQDSGFGALRMVAPFAVGALVVGIVGSAAQVRPGFFPKVIVPKFSALSPKAGIKRLVSIRSLARLVKDVIKLAAVASVTWWILSGEVDALMGLAGADPQRSIGVVSGIVMKLGMAVAATFVVIAVVDVVYERWQHEKDMRMTKDEVKREMKESDVAPEVKAQLKRRQREMAISRMMAAVPEADVVITNPTHFAVALRYARSMPAPMVVAKGADRVAFRIRAVATEHGVAVLEDPPLARSLFAAAEVGQYIPADAFSAVAEILAHVYRIAGREPALA